MILGTFALIIVLILHIKKVEYHEHDKDENNKTLSIMNATISNIIDEGIIQQTADAANMQFSNLWRRYYPARRFNFGWSYDVGIVGVLISMITSIMWIVMAKVLRYTTVGISV